jgi:hypothetical protein
MTPAANHERWETELIALREELGKLRAEQQQMAVAIQELVTTFRTLATHLGIASEPYARKGNASAQRDLPGFA